MTSLFIIIISKKTTKRLVTIVSWSQKIVCELSRITVKYIFQKYNYFVQRISKTNGEEKNWNSISLWLVHVGMPLSYLSDISFRDIYSSSIDVIFAIRKPLHLLPHRQDYNSRWNQ